LAIPMEAVNAIPFAKFKRENAPFIPVEAV
jgi:hypothetical protein